MSANFFYASGAAESRTGGIRKVGGKYVQSEDGGIAETGFVPREYPCDHRSIRNENRCLGCGRTRNEILLDGER
jgi:hypothetical protein